MMISHKMKSILIHIHEPAGASFEPAIRRGDPAAETGAQSGRRHLFAREVQTIARPKIRAAHHGFAYVCSFAYVRNPLALLASWTRTR